MPTKPGDIFGDDETISPETVVLRRIPPGRIVSDGLDQRPQSGNFSNHPDGTGTSVSILAEGRDPLDVLEGLEGFGLVKLTVKDIRDAELGIVHHPLPDDPLHAHIQGSKTTARKRRLAMASIWIKRPEDTD